MRALTVVIVVIVFCLNAEAAEVPVTTDKGVPSAAINSIKQVSSPYGVVPLGKPVPVGDFKNNITLLATNSTDDIILAASIDSVAKEAVLSARSTAIILVSMLQGPLPEGILVQKFHRAIENSTAFPELVSKVEAALQKAVPPINYEGVAKTAALVSCQAMTEIYPQLGVTKCDSPAAKISTVPARIDSSTAANSKVSKVDACLKRMRDYAIHNHVDPGAYITKNQSYVKECVKAMP